MFGVPMPMLTVVVSICILSSFPLAKDIQILRDSYCWRLAALPLSFAPPKTNKTVAKWNGTQKWPALCRMPRGAARDSFFIWASESKRHPPKESSFASSQRGWPLCQCQPKWNPLMVSPACPPHANLFSHMDHSSIHILRN